jgi:parallel beta-helix repeat protein
MMNRKRMVAIWMSLVMVSAFVLIVDTTVDYLPSVEGTMLYVNETGSGGAFIRIQDAINASSDGDTVYVYSGTYIENIVVNRSINLTGEGRESTMIDANVTGYAIYVDANHTNISGFTIRNSTADGYGGIMVHNVTNCSVYNSTVTANQIGIRLHTSHDCEVYENNISGNDIGINSEMSSNNIIRDNLVTMNEYGVYAISSDDIIVDGNDIQSSGTSGVYFQNSNVTISGNVLSDNYYGITGELSLESNITQNAVQSSGQSGIFIENCSSSVIDDNDVMSNGKYGIFLESCTFSTVLDNYLYNSTYGVALSLSSQNTLDGNEVLEDYDGIYLYYSDSNTISNNLVNESGESGISLIYSSDNTVSDNNVAMGEIYGFYLTNSSTNDIFHNAIDKNAYQAYDDEATNNWDSGHPGGGNYWSDYMGFDNFSGLNQDIPGSDSLGDTPYEIDSDSLDNYPLLDPLMDMVPPRIRLLFPENNSYVTSGIDLDFYISDGNLDYAEYSTDGSSWNTLPFPFIISTSGWLEGSRTLWIRAQDTLGNLAQKSFQFMLDFTEPQIQLVSPNNESVIKRGTPIDLQITDSHGVHVNYSLNGGNLTPLSSPYDLNTSNWLEGHNSILINATDNASNIQSVQFIFTIDSTAPQVSEMGVMVHPGETQGGANVSLNVTDVNGVLGVWMEITDPNDVYIGNFSAHYDPSTSRYYLNETYDIVGTYQVIIWAADSIGNWFSSSETFQIVILATEPMGLSAQSGDSYVFLTWSPPNSTGGLPLTGYRIFKSIAGSQGYETIDLGNVTQYNDTDVANDFTYYYTVAALTDAGAGPLSNEEAAKPQSSGKPPDPSKPRDLPDWLLWLIIIIIALFVILLLVMLKRRSKDETPPPPPEERQ